MSKLKTSGPSARNRVSTGLNNELASSEGIEGESRTALNAAVGITNGLIAGSAFWVLGYIAFA